MKAMILAAGEGRRMLPLTATTPKPLLHAQGRPLIDWHLQRLAVAGFREVVINLHYLGDQLQAYLGDGSRYGLAIQYSVEATLLDTAGGIRQALPLLAGDQPGVPFLVVNGDVFTDYDFSAAPKDLMGCQASLVLVPNPPHHPEGDYSLDSRGKLGTGLPRLTYAGIGVYSPDLFAGLRAGPVMLREVFAEAVAAAALRGERYDGVWVDVGTPARLSALNAIPWQSD